MVHANQRDGFGESERGTFAFGEERSFTPGGDGVEPLLGFANGARVFGVHVEAVSASIDLRSAELYQFEQQRLEAALVNVLLHRGDSSVDFRIELLHADSLIQGCSQFSAKGFYQDSATMAARKGYS
jgi:hypothetical protein